MKEWGWTIALVLVLVIAGCEVWRSQPVTTLSPEPQTSEMVTSLELSVPRNVPQVGTEQLVEHLQALGVERYSRQGRDRARQYLINTLRKYGWRPEIQPFAEGANVVAYRPGTDPTAKTLLVGAHYDTVSGSPGLDDNATGVVATLEVARLLGPRSTQNGLTIAFFDLEEQGLLGSAAFVAKPTNTENLLGFLNLEMLGYACQTPGCQTYPEGLPITPLTDRGDFLAAVGDREHPYLLEAFQLTSHPAISTILTVPIPFKGILTPDVLRSDHAPFWANNIGAVMITDTANFRNPHYHQPTDTFATLNLPFFTGATQLVVNATTALLESDAKQ